MGKRGAARREKRQAKGAAAQASRGNQKFKNQKGGQLSAAAMKKRTSTAGLSKAAKKKRRWSKGFREDAPQEEPAVLVRNGKAFRVKGRSPAR